MQHLSLRLLTEIIGGRLRLGIMPPIGGDLEPVGRIVTSLEEVTPGSVFWGLPGEACDGCRYAEQAFARGAQGAVVAGRRLEPFAGQFAIEVEDSRWALWQLARWSREQFSGRVVAITGTHGKTTAGEMIQAVLAANGRENSSDHSFVHPATGNDRESVALSLARLAEQGDLGLIEIAPEHAGRIDSLARLCRPDITVLTGAEEEIHEVNREQGPRQNSQRERLSQFLSALASDSYLVANGDDAAIRRLARQTPARVLLYGRGVGCDFAGDTIRQQTDGLHFTYEGRACRLPVFGRHKINAALAALAVARLHGISTDAALAALGGLHRSTRRCELQTVDRVTIIDDTTTATPTTMRAALQLLRDLPTAGRRILVLGDFDLPGITSRVAHRQLGTEVVTQCGADLLIATGLLASDVINGACEAGMPASRTVRCNGTELVLPLLRKHLRDGDVVLIKGQDAAQLHTLAVQLAGGSLETVNPQRDARLRHTGRRRPAA